MKLLYWLSFVPQAPFKLITLVSMVIAWASEWVSAQIHDCISYPIWLKLHQRAMAQMRK